MIKLFLFILLSRLVLAQNLENSNTSPIHILGNISKLEKSTQLDTAFNPLWVKDLRLLLPCKKVKIPKRASRLPNAPRTYRNGTHKGIDFFATGVQKLER